MSWNYTIQQINQSFDQIAAWYQDFMERTERAFRALHARITFLEERQAWRGPSDEQVERILRKILAEKFGDPGNQRVVNPNTMQNGDYYVQKPSEDFVIPKPLSIDPGTLFVDSNAVPSEAYRKNFEMLEQNLKDMPEYQACTSVSDDQVKDGKASSVRANGPAHTPTTQHNSKPWT